MVSLMVVDSCVGKETSLGRRGRWERGTARLQEGALRWPWPSCASRLSRLSS